MAYDTTNLSVVGSANGFTSWHYRRSDPLSAVLAPGYFDAAHRLINAGDLVALNTDGGLALAFVLKADRHTVQIQVIGQTQPTIKQDAAA